MHCSARASSKRSRRRRCWRSAHKNACNERAMLLVSANRTACKSCTLNFSQVIGTPARNNYTHTVSDVDQYIYETGGRNLKRQKEVIVSLANDTLALFFLNKKSYQFT